MIKRDSIPVFCSVFLLVFVSIIASWSNVYSSQVKKPIIKQDLVPSNLLKWGTGDSDHLVIVDKSSQKVMVYRGDNLFLPEKVYNCSTGENDGPKYKKNDRKTPEGIYYFTDSYVDRYLAPIYGVRAFPISYPNFLDKKDGKGGYGIWFHGTNKPLKPNDTNGCIAMANDDIDEFASHIELFKTPIIISSNIEMVPFKKNEQDAEELTDIVEAWRKAWQSKNVDRYISYYHNQFVSGNKNREQWKRYKRDLAKKYKNIDVQVDNLELLSNDGVVLARFTQRYRTSSLDSRGVKSLYFKKNSNKWKIIGEFFTGEDKSAAVPKKPPVDDLKEIEKLIYQWVGAWENKDVKFYISCYDNKFSSRDMGLDEWKEHRIRLNNKYSSLDISIAGLKIKKDSGSTASVSFKQSYKADNYRDYGLKNMVLVKIGKDWKIREEEWSPLRK
ncbi:L,D-transpeptidase family protein [Thermodesulfobacteriota bacterium]